MERKIIVISVYLMELRFTQVPDRDNA